MDWNSATTKKHIKEAEAVGLTLVGEGKDCNHRIYIFSNCKHQKEIQITNVRNNKFGCDKCLKKKLEDEAKAVGLTLIGDGKKVGFRIYSFNKCGHKGEKQTRLVRTKQIRCNDCLQEKMKQEAKAVGLKIIGDTNKKGLKLYKFKKCGHTQEIFTTSVRNNRFRCHSCFKEQLKNEAKAVGLTLLGEGKSQAYRIYKCNICDHHQEIQFGAVRRNNFRCENCFQTKLKNEAKAVGLELIGKGKNKDYRKYRFNQCGHIHEVHKNTVRFNNPRCHICHKQKLQKEAKAVGLTLVGKVEDPAYRKYKFNHCGHTQDIPPSHIRNGYFRCMECEDTNLKKPSKVYILEITSKKETFLKLGYASNIKRRTYGYGLSKSAKIKKLKVVDFKTGREALDFEKSLHKKYKKKRLPLKKMKEHFQSQGFSECYPLEMLDKLLEELESK